MERLEKFINHISGKYDTKERIGGTLSSIIFSYSQGIKMFRVHNVKEVNQGLQVFEALLNRWKKYFGTDGIRGKVNLGNINGEKFFKFGLAAGTYFKNLKKKNKLLL